MEMNQTLWTPLFIGSLSFFSVVGLLYVTFAIASIVILWEDRKETKGRTGCFSEIFALIFVMSLSRTGNFAVVLIAEVQSDSISVLGFLNFFFIILSPILFYAIFCRLVLYWAWVCKKAEAGRDLSGRYRSFLTLYYGISGSFVVIVTLVWASFAFLPTIDGGDSSSLSFSSPSSFPSPSLSPSSSSPPSALTPSALTPSASSSLAVADERQNLTQIVDDSLNVITDVFCGAIAAFLVVGCAVFGRKSFRYLTAVEQSQLRKAGRPVSYTIATHSSSQYTVQQVMASAKLVGKIRALGIVSAVSFALRAAVDFAMMTPKLEALVAHPDVLLFYFSIFSVLFELTPCLIVALYFLTTKRLKRNPSFPREKLALDRTRGSRVNSSAGYLALSE